MNGYFHDPDAFFQVRHREIGGENTKSLQLKEELS
jgi:hypothetical protein